MKRTREDFNKRKKEVERYFDFLQKLDKDNPTLNYSERDVKKSSKIDTELLKIIRANGYLLIYNLVESACRNACLAIFSAIGKKKLTFSKLSEESQKLWIDYKLKENETHILTTEIIQKNLIEFQSLLEALLNSDHKDKEKYKGVLGISGNIDAKKMRDLAKKYGFSEDVGEAKKGEHSLLLIKKMRNELAHGRLTFTESVDGKSVTDMVKYKDETIAYLEAFLNNIETHIRSKKFKQQILL